MNILLHGVGTHISSRIVEKFASHGIVNDLLYNPNFRYVVGGPKWIPRDNQEFACFRKYIGVKGKGDFTLITRHPREVLNLDEIVHSHADPQLWLEHPGYADYVKFASVRNPIDILNSSVFSLNALASEYIQKFIPPEQDNDTIRQELALYKLTDLNFFEGLVKFLSEYFEDFMKVYNRYILMKWEDLIQQPVPTILRLAEESRIPISQEYAANIWSRLDHMNLTQAHKHNYRVGHGVVDGWKKWMTNHHLKMIKEYGLEKHMIELGYGKIELLDESKYTSFQKEVSTCINMGRIKNDFFDSDLFTFAFNKSNLVSEKFPFKRYGWLEHTQIERSIFEDEELQNDIWNCAEQACAEVNSLLETYLQESKGLEEAELVDLLNSLQKEHQNSLGSALGKRYTVAFMDARASIEQVRYMRNTSAISKMFVEPAKRKLALFLKRAFYSCSGTIDEVAGKPRLILSEVACNVVEYSEKYYALPHALGPIQLDKQDVRKLPGVFITDVLDRAVEYAKKYR